MTRPESGRIRRPVKKDYPSFEFVGIHQVNVSWRSAGIVDPYLVIAPKQLVAGALEGIWRDLAQQNAQSREHRIAAPVVFHDMPSVKGILAATILASTLIKTTAGQAHLMEDAPYFDAAVRDRSLSRGVDINLMVKP
jgi:hypothetical protein